MSTHWAMFQLTNDQLDVLALIGKGLVARGGSDWFVKLGPERLGDKLPKEAMDLLEKRGLIDFYGLERNGAECTVAGFRILNIVEEGLGS